MHPMQTGMLLEFDSMRSVTMMGARCDLGLVAGATWCPYSDLRWARGWCDVVPVQ
ncbi:hypothetical protein KQI74_22755 [Paenibacillus barcinonensis]|uniref:hypothetical protein n=1 Tax=Paenibacillus barcinonensis TaxID=198119 RepID=UPI001C0FEC83|nr:hypothetical protein [Paenibacillus barcinonensis]MBU5355109.1 hypothetical protein [Paenibacillus barcinonensis]